VYQQTAHYFKTIAILEVSMTESNSPPSGPKEFVDEHREELMEILLNGDRTLRALAIAILLEGGDDPDIELVKRELELFEELDEKVQDELR
jgi:hypothetical protein